MGRSGRQKGRSARTKENKVRVLTKQYNRGKKIQDKMTLIEWLKQVKEPNKNK